MLSPVRLSSVCNVRAPYILSLLKFSAMFLRHVVPWPSVEIRKFYGDRPRETPSWGGGKRKRGSQIGPIVILDLSKAVSQKRCKIGGKLVLITNRKL